MIKKIEERIKKLEELKEQCKANVKNPNIDEDIKWYDKGTKVAIREEVKFLKELLKDLKGE